MSEVAIKVPFVDLGKQYQRFRDQIIEKIDQLSLKGQYIQGEEVREFELKLAQLCQVKHVIGVANGTDALVLILKAFGIGPGDEVITAPNSFVATAGAIGLVGATPVFVDVAADFNINPDLIEAAITPNTKAIIPVHLTGHPADMETINALAERYSLKVIEDSAQAIGALYKGRPVGSLGHAAAFSLHPLKNLHLMGDAGFISTNDEELADRLRRWQNHGLINRDKSEHWGYNSRLDAIQAAVGNIKLTQFEQLTQRFMDIAATYFEGLKRIVACPQIHPECRAVFHNFILRTASKTERDRLMQFLAEQGIETKIHYPIPIHLMPSSHYLGYQPGDFPEAEHQADTILSLPIYPELTDDQVKLVIDGVQRFYKKD
jgi:dTDP-4-amino-4,6-dideoxygalactose transaminase